MDYDIIIIGSGHNGLVASFYLAQAGWRVLIVEAKRIIGGCCVTEELIPGYRFSTCANIVWALRPKIARDMELERRGLVVDPRRLLRVLPDGRYLFSPANPVNAAPGESLGVVQQEIAKFSPADAATFPRWQDFCERLSRLLGPHLMRKAPRWGEIYAGCADPEDGKALDLIMTNSVADLADRYFESDVMRDVGSGGADIGDVHDVGSGLLFALSTAMGAYSETGEHVPHGFVRGGMGRVTETMLAAAAEHGVEVVTGSPVARIVVEKGRAIGIELASGEIRRSRVVVSNADPKRTFLKMLPASDLDPGFRERVRRLQTHAAAGLKFHAALSEPLEYRVIAGLNEAQLRGATLIIAPDRAYREAAWRTALRGDLPDRPIMSGNLPSIYDPTLAPPGKHTFSAYMVWAPARLRQGTWSERKEEMMENIIKLLEGYTCNIRRALTGYVLLTPEDLESQNFLTDGNIHHLDAIPSQLLWQRPLEELADYRTPLQGLYLCGSGTHPWGEVSGAPGYNAAQAVLTDLGRRPPGHGGD